MASYPAVIELRVDGVTQVTRVLDTIDKLDKALVSIKKTPLAIDAKNAIDGIRVLKTEVDKFAIGLSTGTKQLASTTAGLNAQATAFRTLAANVKIGGQAFKLYTQAAEQARQKTSLVGGLAEIKALQNLYGAGRTAPTQAFKGIDELLKLGATIPKNIASLQLYRSELQNVINVVDAGSADFFELARAIRAVDMQLDSLQEAQRGAGIGRQLASPIRGTPDMPGSPIAKEEARKKASKQLENIALGAGFPLLFGGGAGEVAGGVLGSFAGEGFGGQIIGSAFGRILQDLGKAAAETGDALRKPIQNFEKLRQANLFASTEQEEYIQRLIDNGEALKANEEIQKRLTSVIGVSGVQKLQEAASSSKRLNSALAEIFLTMQEGTAGPVVRFERWLISLFERVSELSKLQIRSEDIRKRTAGPARVQLEKEIGQLEFQRMFRGMGEEDFITKMTALLDKAEKTAAPKQKLAPTLDVIKKELEAETQLGEAYASRYKTQLEKGALIKQLNGELSQDYIKLNDLQQDYLATNELLAVKIAALRRIEAAGGVAKGVATRQEVNQLKQEIADLSNEKIELKIEANKESLRLFQEDLKRSTEATLRQIDFQAGAIQGRSTVQQSQYDLMRNINDIQLQRLSFEEQLLEKAFEQTTNYDQQLRILARLEQIIYQRFNLTVANANVERLAAKAALKANTELLKLDVQRQRVKEASIKADVAMQRAMGIYNADQDAALNAQKDAVSLSVQTLNYAIENAKVQERIADAVYTQKVEAAAFARNMELTALASRKNEVLNKRYGEQTGGFQIGRVRTGPSYEVPSNAIKKMARGGYVTRPTFAIVGEGGEPEFVVPQSKASAFAENWMSGRRGAEAIPRMSAGASNSPPSINITTGPVMQQEGTKYVTLADMESAMQSMASAMLGSNRSYSGRRYQGVR